jgi:hypothetical protein
MIKKHFILLFIFISFLSSAYASKYEAKNFILTYPDEWTPAYMEPKLTLIPEDGVVIEIESRDIKTISKEIGAIKKEKGSSQPANLLDVLNYNYAKELMEKEWKPYRVPKIKKVGGFKTIYSEFERNDEYTSLYVFEKEDVFAFILKAKSPDLFENYKNIVYSLIASNFSVKAGNPIYMVIGMTIAYVASFIGLISAYYYYRRRQGGIK